MSPSIAPDCLLLVLVFRANRASTAIDTATNAAAEPAAIATVLLSLSSTESLWLTSLSNTAPSVGVAVKGDVGGYVAYPHRHFPPPSRRKNATEVNTR